jgi:hypothetical protein
MSEDNPIPALVTRVGHASWGDNLFRGHSVDTELAGKRGMWGIVSLAIGGPHLDATDEGVLDDIAACSLAADPRIWPMKLARLGSAYGSYTTGLFTGMKGTEQAQVGIFAVTGIARLLVDLAERLERGGVLRDEVERIIVEHRRFPGFGVPFRDEDERVVALRRCVEARGRAQRRYWALVTAIEAQLSERKQLSPNFAAAMGSLLLDLGFAVEQLSPMAAFAVIPNFLANAYEGAGQRPAVLQRLPGAAIEYVGMPFRESPRARAEREAAEASRSAVPPREPEP